MHPQNLWFGGLEIFDLWLHVSMRGLDPSRRSHSLQLHNVFVSFN